MFLLNINQLTNANLDVEFTIQNVSIKWYIISWVGEQISYLQYKMFLLNISIRIWNWFWSTFTIQNVSIKFNSLSFNNNLLNYLQYKMFLLNEQLWKLKQL